MQSIGMRPTQLHITTSPHSHGRTCCIHGLRTNRNNFEVCKRTFVRPRRYSAVASAKESDAGIGLSAVLSIIRDSPRAVRATLVGTALSLALAASPAGAADFVKTGICLFGNCPIQLAKCIADATCAENLVCLNNCNGRPDESECQIRCGDRYASAAVQEFTKCAVTEKGCVGKRVDKDIYPVPPDTALVNDFDLDKFTGEWSITAGLNTLFDTFDCQVHNFSIEKPGTLHADIHWRIQEADGDFIERNTVQTFDQEKGKPGHLHNGDNDFLDYTDDWYILGFKPEEYAVIYYRGNNDAWAGYGGCTVYTRARDFPAKYAGEIEEALKRVGLGLKDLRRVDNSCKPHPKETLEAEAEGEFLDLNPPRKDTTPPPLDKIRQQGRI